MKKILLLTVSVLALTACDKSYVCNCGYASGGPAYKKVYLTAKSDGGAERQCKKQEEADEVCVLE